MPDRKQIKRPKILIIGPTPPPYHGVAVSTRLILDSPALRKFRRLHLDTSDRRGIENIGAFDWRNIALGVWHFIQFMRIMLRHRPRLVYLPISQGMGGYLRDLVFLLPSRWMRVPTVVHLRGSEFRTFYSNAPRPMKALIRYSLSTLHRVIVLGESLRPLFQGLVPAHRVLVVPNGTVDFVSTMPAIEKKCSGVHGLFLSNLRLRKGVLVALQAAIEALRRFPTLEFVFAGEWQSEEVQEQALTMLRNCEVADRIHFVGIVVGDEKHRLLMTSDFLVFPPIEPEGHPRVVLEAMAACLPVISTPQGAIVETVVDGQTGFLVEPGNVGAIVEKISYLVENPEARCKMGRAARERFEAHYTAEVAHARLAAVLSEVLGGVA